MEKIIRLHTTINNLLNRTTGKISVTIYISLSIAINIYMTIYINNNKPDDIYQPLLYFSYCMMWFSCIPFIIPIEYDFSNSLLPNERQRISRNLGECIIIYWGLKFFTIIAFLMILGNGPNSKLPTILYFPLIYSIVDLPGKIIAWDFLKILYNITASLIYLISCCCCCYVENPVPQEIQNNNQIEVAINDVKNNEHIEVVINDVKNNEHMEVVINDVKNNEHMEVVINDVKNNEHIEVVINDVKNNDYREVVFHDEDEKEVSNEEKIVKIYSAYMCPICLDPFDNRTEIITECKHKFHFNCMEDWKKRNNSCPLCRENL